MFISKKRFRELEKRVADLEKKAWGNGSSEEDPGTHIDRLAELLSARLKKLAQDTQVSNSRNSDRSE